MKESCLIYHIPFESTKEQNLKLRKRTEAVLSEQLQRRAHLEKPHPYTDIAAVPSHRNPNDTHIHCCFEGLLLTKTETLALCEKIVGIIREIFGECVIRFADKDNKVDAMTIGSRERFVVPM